MNNNGLSEEQIGEIRDDFENQWSCPFLLDNASTVSSDPNFNGDIKFTNDFFPLLEFGEMESRRSIVSRFLESHGFYVPFPEVLVAGVVLDDTQLCWSKWSDWIAENFRSIVPSHALECFHSLPRLEMFADWLGDVESNPELWRTLAQNEFEYRQRFGDAISLEWYRTHYGCEICPLQDVSSREVAFDCHHYPMEGRIVLGRRRRDDPLGSHCLKTELGYRLVIADPSNCRISREQMWVIRLSRDIAAIGHLKETASRHSKANIELNPFPFQIEIEDVRLNFY